MRAPPASERAAKALGPLLWLAGFAWIFLATDQWPWGAGVAGAGYLLSYFGWWKESERLRREIEALSPGKLRKWELV
jgi:hypothetical protein